MLLNANAGSSQRRNETAVRSDLSFKLCRQLADLFPGSTQARLLGLSEADDRTLWQYAKASGFVIVSQDADFAEMAALHGPPPKVIWLRSGNRPTEIVEAGLRTHANAIGAFERDAVAACLEIY
jgi:predicted nuclease of predicted toxin-antitoxin system